MDVIDQPILLSSFDTFAGAVGWNVAEDINRDGSVDVLISAAFRV